MEHPAEHLEHVEHQKHAVHDSFDRKVAMTMAIVAAGLAAVTLLSHRAHNDTLLLQSEAGVLQTEANIKQTEANIQHTRAADQWGFYQAKKIRQSEYESNLELSSALAKEDDEKVQKARERWSGQVKKYKKELPEMMKEARGYEHKADDYQKESLKLQEESVTKQKESKATHHRADFFDGGELGIELALILCSIAVLTKRRAFWLFGILFGLLGAAVTAFGFLPHH